MPRIDRRLALVVALAVAFCPGVASAATSPAAVVDAFYHDWMTVIWAQHPGPLSKRLGAESRLFDPAFLAADRADAATGWTWLGRRRSRVRRGSVLQHARRGRVVPRGHFEGTRLHGQRSAVFHRGPGRQARRQGILESRGGPGQRARRLAHHGRGVSGGVRDGAQPAGLVEVPACPGAPGQALDGVRQGRRSRRTRRPEGDPEPTEAGRGIERIAPKGVAAGERYPVQA